MVKTLTLQQRALWYWWLHGDLNALTSYHINNGWEKVLTKTLKTESEISNLFISYKDNPNKIAENMIRCLQKIVLNDNNQWNHDKKERLNRYLKQYIDLITQFDQVHFPHLWSKWPVYQWIPNYIPNWFVDFWSNQNLNTDTRNWREKLIINKNDFYQIHQSHIINVLSQWLSQKEIVWITHNYIWDLPVSKTPNNDFWWASIPLSEISDNQEMVCRHKAITMQLIMQFFWIESHLLKCDVRSEKSQERWAHVANLIKYDENRHLIDTIQSLQLSDWKSWLTNLKIKQQDIDLNNLLYNREITKKIIPTLKYEKKYRSRNNMYYQIR